MLKLTRKTEYALISLRYLQLKADGKPVTAREISDIENIPLSLLSKILQHLSKVNLIEPVIGAKGGYQLSVNLNNVNLWKFLETMEGPLGLVDCLQNTECEQEVSCNIQSPIKKINLTVKNVFNNLSVSDITI